MIIIFLASKWYLIEKSGSVIKQGTCEKTYPERRKLAWQLKEEYEGVHELLGIAYNGTHIKLSSNCTDELDKTLRDTFQKQGSKHRFGTIETDWQPLRFKRGDRVWFKGEWWYVSDTMTDTHANWTYSLFRDLDDYWKGTETVWRGQEDEVHETKSGQTDIFDFMEES